MQGWWARERRQPVYPGGPGVCWGKKAGCSAVVIMWTLTGSSVPMMALWSVVWLVEPVFLPLQRVNLVFHQDLKGIWRFSSSFGLPSHVSEVPGPELLASLGSETADFKFPHCQLRVPCRLAC